MTWTRTHTQLTSATEEQLWRRWTTAAYWPQDDPGVQWVRFDGEVRDGTTGTLKSHGAPASKLTFTRVVERKYMDFEIRLPLATMTITHTMEPVGDALACTHGVTISGPLTPVYARLVGRKLAAGLPDVVGQVTRAALAG